MPGITRRALVAQGAALVAMGGAQRLRAARPGGFTHGVASGEPTAESVLLWTRFVGDRRPGGGPVPLTVEVAGEPGFRRILARAGALADPEADWTARATVAGLPPGAWLWYRWRAPDGSSSPTGRTRTLPAGQVERFGLALFSCTNLGFGWFNAMAHAARRDDLDLAVHLGDYVYEYPLGTYPGSAKIVAGRDIAPTGATVSLADYRQRYASYRRCPDLQALHARLPWLAVWDDHEFADNAWMEGAWNHDSASEGSWAARKAAAERAWREWMPVSASGYWSAHPIGDLATLFRLETRITGRTASPDLYGVGARGEDLAAFATAVWRNPAGRMLGPEQEGWLVGAMAASARRTPWQVLLQSVPMGHAILPEAARAWPVAGGAEGEAEVRVLVEAGRLGIPYNMDNWGGFPVQRSRILAAAREAGANLLVTAGDSHNGWGHVLLENGRRVGVELCVPSVTSPGFERWFPRTPPVVVAAALTEANPELRFAETSRRGYGCLTLTPDRAHLRWHFTGSPTVRSARIVSERTGWVKPGDPALHLADVLRGAPSLPTNLSRRNKAPQA